MLKLLLFIVEYVKKISKTDLERLSQILHLFLPKFSQK